MVQKKSQGDIQIIILSNKTFKHLAVTWPVLQLQVSSPLTYQIFLFLFFSWKDWIPCKISCVESVRNLQPDFTSALLLAKVANPSLAALVTINQSSRNAKTITDASSTRRTERHAKHAD